MIKPNIDLEFSELPVFVPVLSVDRYAKSIGIDVGVVDGWVKRGYIPTIKIGKRRLINIAAMTQELSS